MSATALNLIPVRLSCPANIRTTWPFLSSLSRHPAYTWRPRTLHTHTYLMHTCCSSYIKFTRIMHSDRAIVSQFTKQHPHLPATTLPFHRKIYTLEFRILAIYIRLLTEQRPQWVEEWLSHLAYCFDPFDASHLISTSLANSSVFRQDGHGERSNAYDTRH